MKFSQNQRAQFVAKSMKNIAVFSLFVITGILLFNVATAEEKGR